MTDLTLSMVAVLIYCRKKERTQGVYTKQIPLNWGLS